MHVVQLSGPGESFEATQRPVCHVPHRAGTRLDHTLMEASSTYNHLTRLHVYGCSGIYSKAFLLLLNETLKVKDAFTDRLTWGMTDLGEGITNYWSWSRTVLVGYVCHKFTPNAVLRLSNTIQDVVALCNRLHVAVSETGDHDSDEESTRGRLWVISRSKTGTPPERLQQVGNRHSSPCLGS